MNFFYRIAADATVCFHMAYVLFVVLGQATVILGAFCGWKWIRNTTFRLLHLLTISIVVVESWLNITCPLTTLEKHLRAKSGATSYNGDFVANAVHDVLFIECEPWVFTAMYSLFGLAVLITLFACPPRAFARLSPTDTTPADATTEA
jgi:drug/metabolite transporter superfamily protein YnfA